jgi:hypothetical protein
MKNLEVAVNSSAKESRLGNTSLRQRQPQNPNPNSAKKLFVLLSSKKNLKQIIDHIYEQIESKS